MQDIIQLVHQIGGEKFKDMIEENVHERLDSHEEDLHELWHQDGDQDNYEDKDEESRTKFALMSDMLHHLFF